MGMCFLGMGECTSTNKVDISDITNNDTNIDNSIKNIINQNCTMSGNQSNTINIVGSTVKKLSATQKNSLDSMCIMQSILSSKVSSDVTNKLLDKVKENLETTGAVLGSPSSNETISKKLTTNKTNVNNSKFNEISKNCIMSIDQKNLLNIIGSNVEDTTTDQANAGFLKCMSQHSDDTGISAAALSDTKNESDITSKAAGGDVGKSVGEAAKGIGEGVSDAAKGIGEGVSGVLDSFFAGTIGNWTNMIIAIVVAIVCASLSSILGSMMMKR